VTTFIASCARDHRSPYPARHGAQHRAPFRIPGRVLEEPRHRARGVGHDEVAARDDAGDVLAERADGRRDPFAGKEQHLGRQHLFLVEALASRLVERTDRQLLEQQGTVDEAGVDPQQKLRIERVVPLARNGIDAVDASMNGVDSFRGLVGFPARPERDRVGELQCALQAFPWIALVEAGLARTGDHQRVRCLHQQGARAPEKDGRLPVDLPRDAGGPKKALVGGGHAIEGIGFRVRIAPVLGRFTGGFGKN